MTIDWNFARKMLLSLALVIPLAACEQEGPAEQAGEQLDQATEEAKEHVQGAAERAGEAVEEAGDKVRSGTQ